MKDEADISGWKHSQSNFSRLQKLKVIKIAISFFFLTSQMFFMFKKICFSKHETEDSETKKEDTNKC